jgi:hypothetical protein
VSVFESQLPITKGRQEHTEAGKWSTTATRKDRVHKADIVFTSNHDSETCMKEDAETCSVQTKSFMSMQVMRTEGNSGNGHTSPALAQHSNNVAEPSSFERTCSTQ